MEKKARILYRRRLWPIFIKLSIGEAKTQQGKEYISGIVMAETKKHEEEKKYRESTKRSEWVDELFREIKNTRLWREFSNIRLKHVTFFYDH